MKYGSIEGMSSTQLFALWLDQAATVLLGVGADECILLRALYIVNVFLVKHLISVFFRPFDQSSKQGHSLPSRLKTPGVKHVSI